EFGLTAWWCDSSPSWSCVTRELHDRGPSSEEVCVGTWHGLSNGVTYAVEATQFRAACAVALATWGPCIPSVPTAGPRVAPPAVSTAPHRDLGSAAPTP